MGGQAAPKCELFARLDPEPGARQVRRGRGDESGEGTAENGTVEDGNVDCPFTFWVAPLASCSLKSFVGSGVTPLVHLEWPDWVPATQTHARHASPTAP